MLNPPTLPCANVRLDWTELEGGRMRCEWQWREAKNILSQRIVIAWLDEQDASSRFISVISRGKIEKGILKLCAEDLRRSQKLAGQGGAGRLPPLDVCALHVWPQIAALAALAGQSLPVMNGLLMATAQCHSFTVVIRNVRDFEGFPQVFNPWVLAE